MDLNEEWKQEFMSVYPNAKFLQEAGYTYIYLSELKLPEGVLPKVIPALLCISPKDGYDSRLYLSKIIEGFSFRNWNSGIYVLDSNWHSISWKTQSGLSYLEMLMVHLTAFKL
ncbi:MAG: hypothetical protein IPI46_08110 [Bacteroidetes bacterium]|nr:hypothetical protein [Bacteroidota bacterium]